MYMFLFLILIFMTFSFLFSLSYFLATSLLLVDQPTPNMFDYANQHHHSTTMANWSAFQLPSTVDVNHQYHM